MPRAFVVPVPSKTLLRHVAAACIAVALTAGGAAAGPARGPVTLATDPSGDWTLNSQDASDAGASQAQDLTSASVDRVGENLDFIIGVADAQLPELARRKTLYEWHFTVDGAEDGYVLYGPCSPDPFDVAFYGCSPTDVASLEPVVTLFGGDSPVIVPAHFDDGSDTITISVPLAAIGAGTGSVISDDTTDRFEATVAATPDENGMMYGSLSSTGAWAGDNLTITKTYRVPRS